ncbi:MAG: transcriptional regulator [Byssovorax sp.]
MKILLYTFAAILNISLTLTLQILDKRRLTEAQRSRAWNTASWGAALYCAFFVGGAASMIPWAWVTRNEWALWRRRGLGPALLRSALTLAAGLGVGALIYGIAIGAIIGLAAALHVPDLD